MIDSTILLNKKKEKMGQFWALNKEKLLLTLLHGHLTLEIYLYVEIEDDYKTCNNNIRLVHVYQGC